MYEIIFIIKNIVYSLLVILFIVNSGNILTGGDQKMKENVFKENFKRAKKLYNALKKDDESVLFASEKINKQLIKKIKRSKYEKDITFLKLYNTIENVNLDEKEEIPTFVPFIENKKDIDNSTLYSFNGPFQLLHADIADIRFFFKISSRPSLLSFIC